MRPKKTLNTVLPMTYLLIERRRDTIRLVNTSAKLREP
jgi:hypothetical protein